jgi:hypothetical protein
MTLILELFPGEGGNLKRLFKESSSFRFLCDDYQNCLAALRQWQLSTSEDAPAMRDICEELRRLLEQEVRQYLEDLAGGNLVKKSR